MDPIDAVIGGLKALTVARALYGALSPLLARRVDAKSDRFLNYDPGFLLEAYAGEHAIANGITYTRVCDLLELCPANSEWDERLVEISVGSTFTRSSGQMSWDLASTAGFVALQASGRISGNETTIRVADASVDSGRLVLTVEKATYHDQARSNLILDFDRDAPGEHVSLRKQLASHYGTALPNLNDPRLANSLGIACLVFYLDTGQWTPYLVRRVSKIGVFPGGVHCTASGVAKWPAVLNPETLGNFATTHMLSELEEEVGLKADDLIDFRPIALCREMARGGKPQLFYCGFTVLNRETLAERRKTAAEVIKATNQWQEVEKDRFFRSADVVLSSSALQAQGANLQLTLEGAASLHLGLKYAEARVPSLLPSRLNVP